MFNAQSAMTVEMVMMMIQFSSLLGPICKVSDSLGISFDSCANTQTAKKTQEKRIVRNMAAFLIPSDGPRPGHDPHLSRSPVTNQETRNFVQPALSDVTRLWNIQLYRLPCIYLQVHVSHVYTSLYIHIYPQSHRMVLMTAIRHDFRSKWQRQ